MQPSLRALLRGVLDYAGMFPPASLPLAEALSEYLSHQASSESWMLARFICPASRLQALREEYEGAGRNESLRVSVILSTGRLDAGVEAWEIPDFDRLAGESTHKSIAVEAVETPVPDRQTGSVEHDLLGFVDGVVQEVRGILGDVEMFFEPGRRPSLGQSTDLLITALRTQSAIAGSGHPPGVKFRCGGDAPGDVPSVPALSSALTAVIGAGIPFKATAGLHHPFRHVDPATSRWMHGFVNVFAAATLSAHLQLGPEDVAEILDSTDPDAFSFKEDRLIWRDLAVESDRIAEIRSSLVTSFGSCSFDEPRDDLSRMGLL